MKKKIIASCLALTVALAGFFAFSLANNETKKVEAKEVELKTQTQVKKTIESQTDSSDDAFNMNATSNETFEDEKEAILEKAFNSIYNIKNASGEYIVTEGKFNEDYEFVYSTNKVEYEVNFEGVPKVYEKMTYVSDNNREVEYFLKDGNVTIVSLDKKEYTNLSSFGDIADKELKYSTDKVKDMKPKDRMRKTADGYNATYYSDDQMLLFSKDSLSPQARLIGFLNQDNWNIEGSETILGRDCAIISGVSMDPYYSEKQNVVNFKFYIDKETGVLINYVGYDKDGNISQEIKTTRIDLETEVMDYNFVKDLSGYTEYVRNYDLY